MPRTIPANTSTEILRQQTRGLYLMQFDFSTPLRLSTRGDVPWNSLSFSGARLDPQFSLDGLSGAFTLFNADWQYTEFIDEGGAGITVTAWELFGEGPFAVADADEIFAGELGQGSVESVIKFNLVQPKSRFTPKQRITSADMRHLPPPGTRFSTPDGIIEL